MFNGRNWKAIMILSVVVPMGLLAMLRFAGLLSGPLQVSEKVTVETIHWDMTRPSIMCPIDREVSNVYDDGSVSSALTVFISDYLEDSGTIFYNDGFLLMVRANASVRSGSIRSAKVVFHKADNQSILVIDETPDWIKLSNLVMRKLDYRTSVDKALFEAFGTGQPRECALEIKPIWIFLDHNTFSHQMTIMLELVYYDGGTYRQIDMPIRLDVIQ